MYITHVTKDHAKEKRIETSSGTTTLGASQLTSNIAYARRRRGDVGVLVDDKNESDDDDDDDDGK